MRTASADSLSGARPLRVLLLAYHFPPTGGAGVQRNLQLARRLEEVGCRPIVVTGPGPTESRWTPDDPGLEGRLIGADVIRLPGPEPTPGSREARLARWLRAPTRWPSWWREGVLRAATAAGPVDVVHASVAPYPTAEAAVAVARLVGKPLVLDFEDPWALDEMLVYPTVAHRRLELRRMRRALRPADAIVMNTAEARRRVLAAFPEFAPRRVHAIPNAFDPLDFAGPPPSRRDRLFRILHTGSLHTDLGLRHRAERRRRRLLGGAVPGVDFLTRSHVYLLEAVDSVVRDEPELGSAVEVVLAGVFTEEDRAVAARYPFVRLFDFVPHSKTIELIRGADLLFLPMHDLPAGRRAGIVPHKTYEYLASGRPVLAAVPDGDARDLLEAAGSPHLCRPADTRAMARTLRVELRRRQAGEHPPPPDPDVVRRCTSSRLVQELATLYETLVAPASVR